MVVMCQKRCKYVTVLLFPVMGIECWVLVEGNCALLGQVCSYS